MCISVVHVNQKVPNAVYIGRHSSNKVASPLANTYKINYKNKLSREEVILRYRLWLFEKLQDSKSAQSLEINRLIELYKNKGEVNLECWCHPKACHGDIIKLVIEDRINHCA